MTKKERINTIMEKRCADRCGTFDIIANDAVIRHFAGEEPDRQHPELVVHRAISRALDAARMVILYPQTECKETYPDGTMVHRKRWTSWTDLSITSLDEATAYINRMLRMFNESDPELQNSIEDYERTARELSEVYLFGNFMAKTGIMLYSQIGLELFSYLMADAPELLDQYYEVVTARNVRAIEKTNFPAGIQAVFDCEDIACRNGLLFPPAYLRKHFIPRLERLIDAWHEKGIKFVFHSDGNLTEILPDLVACGIDALNPIETQAGLNVAHIRRVASDLILIGGVDCSQVLPLGTPADVRRETEKVIREAGPHSIIGSSSEVHNAVPLENYLTMLETIQNWKW